MRQRVTTFSGTINLRPFQKIGGYTSVLPITPSSDIGTVLNHKEIKNTRGVPLLLPPRCRDRSTVGIGTGSTLWNTKPSWKHVAREIANANS